MGKILYIHKGGAGGIRGTEACVVSAIEAMHADGHRIAFARNLPVIDHMVSACVEKISALDIPEIFLNGFHSHLPIRAYLHCLSALAQEIRSFRPDLIVASGGLPCQSAVPLGRWFRVPVLCHYHHPATKRYYYNWLVPYVDHLIFPSEFTRLDCLQKTGRDGRVIYNGVDTQLFTRIPRDYSLRAKLNISHDAVVIGQVGQLAPNKRPEFLLRAFSNAIKTAPNLHLCLVGRGELEEKIREQVAALGLHEKVTVTGFVEDVLPYYQHVFDVNALVSSDEGLGISILEGAACGLPSLISDCTGLSETTINRVTGLAFSPDEESELVDAMIAYARDEALRINAGQAARTLVENKFSLDRYKAGISSTINALVNQTQQ